MNIHNYTIMFCLMITSTYTLANIVHTTDLEINPLIGKTITFAKTVPEPFRLKQQNTEIAINYITNGLHLIDMILHSHDSIIYPANTDDFLNKIIGISWGLYAYAVKKDQPFTGGTIVVHDKDFKIFNYFLEYTKAVNSSLKKSLDKNKVPSKAGVLGSSNCFAYSRKSTHFNAEQKQGKGYEHYGIDIRFNHNLDKLSPARDLLPMNKQHILFGKLDKDLIFVKYEIYGLCNKDGSLKKHTQELISRNSLKSNIRRSEKVPTDETWMTLIKNTKYIASQSKATLKKDSSCKNIKFVHDVYNCVDELEKGKDVSSLIAKEIKKNLLQRWDKADISLRKGNEVILLEKDFLVNL